MADKYDPIFNTRQSQIDFDESLTPDPKIKGFPYPLDRTDERGFFFRAIDHELVKSDLIQLLLTEPGERVMLPSFGTGLRRHVFEQKDDIEVAQLRQLIVESITRWEKRIVLRSVEVNFGDDDSRLLVSGDNVDQTSLIISIEYSLKEDLEGVENLEFRVNLNPVDV